MYLYGFITRQPREWRTPLKANEKQEGPKQDRMSPAHHARFLGGTQWLAVLRLYYCMVNMVNGGPGTMFCIAPARLRRKPDEQPVAPSSPSSPYDADRMEDTQAYYLFAWAASLPLTRIRRG